MTAQPIGPSSSARPNWRADWAWHPGPICNHAYVTAGLRAAFIAAALLAIFVMLVLF